MSENDGFLPDWENEGAFTAQNNFTDRDDFRKILIEAVEKPQSLSERRVKVFYGAGGQGKSALKNDFFIKQYLQKTELENIVFSDKLDFESQEGTRMADEALLRIAQDLIEKASIPLPAFCLGFMRFRMLTAPEKNIASDYPFLQKIKFIENDVANELFNIVVSSLLGLVAVGSQAVPGIGFFTKKIAQKGHAKIVEWIQKSDAKKVLGDLDELHPTQLLQRLPLMLAYDIYSYLKKGVTENNPYPQKRIIIILDGYETLWRNEMNPSVDKDAWIRTLIRNSPGVLFVIFGRDKLQWAERDPSFEGILDQHLLKGLSDQDADSFLQLSNVVEPEVREQIVQSSKNAQAPEDGCLPFYLDILLGIYRRVKRSGRSFTKEEFAKSGEDVVKHFFEHLHPDVAGAIKALSLAEYVDEEIIELFVAHNYIQPNTVSLKSLSRYSFMKAEGRRVTMHGLMKELASAQFHDEFSLRFAKIHEMLFAYFEGKLPTVSQEINAQIEQTLEFAAYHKAFADQKNYYKWASQKAAFFYGKDIHGALTAILHNALSYYFQNRRHDLNKEEISSEDVPVDEILTIAEINFYLSSRYYWMDDYSNAEKYSKRCLTTIDYAESSEKQIEAQLAKDESNQPLASVLIKLKQTALEQYAAVLELMDRYVEAGDFYHKALTLAEDYGLPFDYSAYSDYLTKVGRFAESEPKLFADYMWQKKQFEKAPGNMDLAEILAHRAHRVANMLQKQERYDEAVSYHEEAIKFYLSSRNEDHEYVAIVKNSFARTLMRQNKLDEAEKVLNEVYEIYRKKYPEDHVHFGYYYADLAELYGQKDDLKQAQLYYDQAGQTLSRKIGPRSRAILDGVLKILFLTDRLYNSGKIDEQTYLFTVKSMIVPIKNQLDIFTNVFSIYHQRFQKAIGLVAEILQKMNETENARLLRAKKNEFERISGSRTAIREEYLPSVPVKDEKERLLLLFQSIMSLPQNFDKVELNCLILPFFKTFRLYKLTYKNTSFFVQRYVLSDGQSAFAIDYSNKPIYAVAQTDGVISRETVLSYLQFFFDSVCGRNGFFYLIMHPTDLPWRVDVDTDPEYKDKIQRNLKEPEIDFEDEEKIGVNVFILFKDSIFNSRVTVYKRNFHDPDTNEVTIQLGACQITDERQCICRLTGEMLFEVIKKDEEGKETLVYIDEAGNEAVFQPGEQIVTKVAACIDPPTAVVEKDFEKRSLQENIRIALDDCRNVTENFLRFTEGDEEQGGEWAELMVKIDATLSSISKMGQCSLEDLKAIFSGVARLLEEGIEETAKTMNADDWRLQRFRELARFLQTLLTELDNAAAPQ